MGTHQKIRVCHLASADLWAGPEVQIYTLLSELKKEPEVEVSAVLLNEGKLASLLRNSGISVKIMEESKNSFFRIKSLVQEELKDKGIDILHSHRYKENFLASLLKKKCKIGYLVQTVHGLEEPFFGFKKIKASLYNLLNQFVSKSFFDKIITVSYDMEKRVFPKINPQKLMTIHNAIDLRKVNSIKTSSEVKEELGIDPKSFLITSAGRLVPIKGYDYFLKIAQNILKKRADVKFLLIGEGPEKRKLKKMVLDLGIEKEFLFLGFREDLNEIIAASDIFVMTSLYEGIPMVLLEAMALKKAVVGFAVGGIKEVIEDNVSGILIEPKNIDAFFKTCLKVLDNQELKDNLGNNARKRIEEEFSSPVQKNRVLDFYHNLVREK